MKAQHRQKKNPKIQKKKTPHKQIKSFKLKKKRNYETTPQDYD